MEFKGITYLQDVAEEIDQETFESLPKELRTFYQGTNGLIAFNGGLHIRGVGSDPSWHDLARYWHGEMALHLVYTEMRPSDIPFAQDCLGDQYFYRLGTVWNLMCESGDIEDLELEFDEFIAHCVDDPIEFLSLEPLIEFMSDGGALAPGELLAIDPPLMVEANAYEISKCAVDDRLSKLFELYRTSSANGL